MKIILTAVGTQGDIDPFLAVGKLLKEKGHHVICAFTEQFREKAEENNLEYASLGRKLDELNNSEAGRIILGGGKGFKKLKAYVYIIKNQKEPNVEKERKLHDLIQKENPDRVLYNSKTIYPLIWECKNRGKTTFLSPFPYLHYVKGHSFLVFKRNFNEFINKLTFKLYDFGVAAAAKAAMKWLLIKDSGIKAQLKKLTKERNFIYTISTTLFQRQKYWNANVKVLGYHELKRKPNWVPDQSLIDFIAKYDKILFVTFGSMINPNYEHNSKLFIEILNRNRIPAIINTASGGIIKPEGFDSELIYFVQKIPYDWVFPKMYAVIHHGGSGTTHLALKYACASMIIPHFIDQFVWNNLISEIGAGPKGISVNELSYKRLEPRILELLNDKIYKEKSEEISLNMQKENYEIDICNAILK